MCCLFGFVDYGHKLTRKERLRLLTALSVASEERGTDATGIAYNLDRKQIIYKRPLPAHHMWYRVPAAPSIVMGHTRMATQGSELVNINNHPFPGVAGQTHFSLAHNGVLTNDKVLRKKHKLLATKVETDSYVAVQLLEQYGQVNFDSLRFMAEELEGTFTITVLTDRDELYFVKGNNPLTIYHFPQSGLYVYASTEDILRKGLKNSHLNLGKGEPVRVFTGDILKIDGRGKVTRSEFNDEKLYFTSYTHWFDWKQYKEPRHPYHFEEDIFEDSYIADLKAVAACCGVYPEDIDALLAEGVSLEEIEEYLYCG
ncbi:MAG: hypothetical protein ACI3W5_13405 [Faecousia sp.]